MPIPGFTQTKCGRKDVDYFGHKIVFFACGTTIRRDSLERLAKIKPRGAINERPWKQERAACQRHLTRALRSPRYRRAAAVTSRTQLNLTVSKPISTATSIILSMCSRLVLINVHFAAIFPLAPDRDYYISYYKLKNLDHRNS